MQPPTTPLTTWPAELSAVVRVSEAVRASGYHFVTITPASHALVNARPCNFEALTLTDVLGWSRPFSKNIMPERLFALMFEAGLLERQGDLWRSKVRFSTLNGDLFMHSAFPTTTGRDAVFFGPDTYKFVDAINAWLVNWKSPNPSRGGCLLRRWPRRHHDREGLTQRQRF